MMKHKDPDHLRHGLMRRLLSEGMRKTLKTVAPQHQGTARIGPTVMPLRYGSEVDTAKKATF